LQEWIEANPAAFDWLMANLDKLKRNQRGYCSGSRLRSGLRDHYHGVLKGDGEFGFDNNITKYLKLRIVYLKPDPASVRVPASTKTRPARGALLSTASLCAGLSRMLSRAVKRTA
jgi:hypothetical protein